MSDSKELNLDLLVLTDDEITQGRNYFFKKATEEIKGFVKRTDYEKISTEKNGILYYTGRIMPDQNINAIVKNDRRNEGLNRYFILCSAC